MTEDLLTSRFFLRSDPRCAHLIFDLRPYWWSRPYEYEWARWFCAPAHVALDAGCGLCHPFKFYLSSACAQAHACDADERILSDVALPYRGAPSVSKQKASIVAGPSCKGNSLLWDVRGKKGKGRLSTTEHAEYTKEVNDVTTDCTDYTDKPRTIIQRGGTGFDALSLGKAREYARMRGIMAMIRIAPV